MERLLLVGPRGSRRIAWLQRALHDQGSEPALVVEYEALLQDASRLGAACTPGTIVKLESPGEAPNLHTALIRRGWEASGSPGHAPAALEHGELAHQQWWYAGFRRLLEALPAHLRYFNPPADLACMADKLACQQRLVDAGVPVPTLLGPIRGYDDLREQLRQQGWERGFVKARYGSSGAGVLAFACNAAGREVAYGSAELVEQGGKVRLFNSLRQRRYERRGEIAKLVDALAVQGAYLERWIPKPACPGREDRRYDIRVVTLDGQPRQRLARTSTGALTNLHLGNERGRLEDFLDAEAMATLEAATVQAAAAIPDSRLIGFDLIARGQRTWVLEANGFGDLLPGLQHQGRTTYEDQAALIPGRRALPAERAHG
jgi:glutathione synthase/RimK-type ligase-like ATP-grasp enzyme